MVYESTTLKHESVSRYHFPRLPKRRLCRCTWCDPPDSVKETQDTSLWDVPSKSSGTPWKNLRKYRWYPHRYSKTHVHTHKNNNENVQEKTCKGSPTPKFGGEMSSSRVVSIRYHSNYPCALPWKASFTRHTTSFLPWISRLWMAIHFMTRQPAPFWGDPMKRKAETHLYKNR